MTEQPFDLRTDALGVDCEAAATAMSTRGDTRQPGILVPRVVGYLPVAASAGDRITDLHIWQIGMGHRAAVVSLISEHPRAP